MLNNVILYDEEIAESCIYGADFVKNLLGIENYNNIYCLEPDYALSSKKIEGLKQIAKLRGYYQKNPVKFIRDFFNIQLLDSQAYLMMEAWNKQQVMVVASRAYGKSFWIDLFAMTKQMLSSFPWNCYIASGTSQQSATTFKKLEDIANDRLESLVNSTGRIFKQEVVINNANGDGFSHNPSGFTYNLYNGSFLKTLSSNVDKNRGARASCVCFDETAFLDAELIQVYQAFCAVDKDFKTGVDGSGNEIDNVRLHALPKEIPTQLIYVSSASSTDTEFYRMYREFSKKMLLGDLNYFVADIDCELVMTPTICGKGVKPALTREKIEAQMKTNPEKARREYFNQFTTEAGADAIVRRGVITRNEEVRKPLLYNDTGDKKFILAYDPARQRDNAVILVGEVYDSEMPDGNFEKKVRLVNCVNLLDVGKKIKSPMQTPDQIKYLKQMILDYNGGADGYGNIIAVYIDAGSGGGGVNIADYLMEDWVDDAGITHRGLIDKEFSAEYVKKFPNAVDKIRLMSPVAFKSIMFESMIELMNQNKMSFTATYDNKDYLTVFDTDDKKLLEEKDKIRKDLKKLKLPEEELNKRVEEELMKINSVKTRTIKLNWREKIALVNIDCLKEELVNIVRKKRESGKDAFDLTPEKARTLNDDRAYVCAMLGYGLMQERRKNLTRRVKTNKNDLLDKLVIHKSSILSKR